MPRPEKQIPWNTPAEVRAFAEDLRSLRRQAGLSYKQLSRRAMYSASTLSQAASGNGLPSLSITTAYVRACDGPVESWVQRHREVSTQAQSDRGFVLREDGTPALGPRRWTELFEEVSSEKELLQALREVRSAPGAVPPTELVAAAKRLGAPLTVSAVDAMMEFGILPPLDIVTALCVGSKLFDEEVRAAERAWGRVALQRRIAAVQEAAEENSGPAPEQEPAVLVPQQLDRPAAEQHQVLDGKVGMLVLHNSTTVTSEPAEAGHGDLLRLVHKLVDNKDFWQWAKFATGMLALTVIAITALMCL